MKLFKGHKLRCVLRRKIARWRYQYQTWRWTRRWPHYCPGCAGWGGSSFQESHGMPYGSETVYDPCWYTDNPAICHRCGELGLDECGGGPCSVCGWNYDDGLHQMDEEPDMCRCFEDYTRSDW